MITLPLLGPHKSSLPTLTGPSSLLSLIENVYSGNFVPTVMCSDAIFYYFYYFIIYYYYYFIFYFLFYFLFFVFIFYFYFFLFLFFFYFYFLFSLISFL